MKLPYKEGGRNAAPASMLDRFSLPIIGNNAGKAHLKPPRFRSNQWGEVRLVGRPKKREHRK